MDTYKVVIGVGLAIVDFFASNLIVDRIVQSFPKGTFPVPLVLAMQGVLFAGFLGLIIFILFRLGGSHKSS